MILTHPYRVGSTHRTGGIGLKPRCPSWSPQVPRVPGASRRQQYSASTKRALVDVAEELFTEHGYADTSLDAIVAGARVTKGALYHHFSGKQALFEAVFEQVETRRLARPSEGAQGHSSDPWEKALAGLRAFLAVVREPRYRRIVIQEGPAVLGYERFREQEERSTFANVLDIVRSVLERRRLGARRGRCCRRSPGSSSARCPRPASRSATADDPDAAAGGSRPRSASSSPASSRWPSGVELPATRLAADRRDREPDYFPKVTSPPSRGTSSIQCGRPGTVSSPALVDS